MWDIPRHKGHLQKKVLMVKTHIIYGSYSLMEIYFASTIPEFAGAALCIPSQPHRVPFPYARNRKTIRWVGAIYGEDRQNVAIVESYPEWSFWRRAERSRGCWFRTWSGQSSGPNEAREPFCIVSGLSSRRLLNLSAKPGFDWASSRSTWTSSHDFAIAQQADCRYITVEIKTM